MDDFLANLFPKSMEALLSWSNLLQFIGFTTGVWSIYLIGKSKILGWWMAFPGIIASMVVFYDSALYGEVFLQVIFLISGILGIYNWQVLGRSKKEQVLHKLGLKWYLPYLGLFIVFYLGFYYFLISFTDSTTPHWDALITAMSLVAQLMLTRQIFENWILWVIVDVCSVGLYWYKGIPLYAVLYLVYLYLALQGWYIWHRNLKEGKVLAE